MAKRKTVNQQFVKKSKEYAPTIVSSLVIAGFFTVCVLLFIKIIPTESQQIAQVLFGGLVAMATTVVNYWLGSSAGSSKKDEFISRIHDDNKDRDDRERDDRNQDKDRTVSVTTPDISTTDTTVKVVSANTGNVNTVTTTTQTTDMNNLLGGR